MSQLHEVCDCELPGAFYTGVPGVLAAMEEGRVAPGAVVERCDQCQRFPTDAEALSRLRECGLVDGELVDGGPRSFTVHCYVVVRVQFPGVVAVNERSAAQQVLDRFDWDRHGAHAEFVDEVTELLVDLDGDAEFRRSRRFTPLLEEVAA